MKLGGLPAYHCRPLERLEKPVSLQKPDNHPPEFMRPDICSKSGVHGEQAELVYDPMTQVNISTPRFTGDFECGNLSYVYRTAPTKYEIHILPDPNPKQTAQWFFFRVEDLEPGNYMFTVVGFYRRGNLHTRGSRACAYSESAARGGIGWRRLGSGIKYFKWKKGKRGPWALSFEFTVNERDTMWFSHAYPYTYTDLGKFMASLGDTCLPSTLCKSMGGLPVPVVFWDADQGSCVNVCTLFETSEEEYVGPDLRVEKLSEFSDTVVNSILAWRDQSIVNDGDATDEIGRAHV